VTGGSALPVIRTAVVPPLPRSPTAAGRTDGGGPEALRLRLSLAEQRLRATVEASPSGIAIYAGDGTLLQANDTLCRMLGISPGPDPLVLEAHPEDEAREAALLRRLRDGASNGYRLAKRWRRADGGYLDSRTTVAAVRLDQVGPGGEPRELLQLVVQVEELLAEPAPPGPSGPPRHDQLTGVANRTSCLDRIQLALDQRHRHGGRVAVLACDLDDFGALNDSLGPELGDTVLRVVAERLQQALQPGPGLLARLAADEFAVVLPAVPDREELLAVTEQLAGAVQRPISLAGRELRPSLSVGAALSTAGHTDAHELLRDAGIALHHAQAAGRGGLRLLDDGLRGAALARFDLEAELRTAVEGSQLRLHLQPIVDLTSGAIVGREALVRWQHPTRGLLGPAEFLPLAEDTGLMVGLGSWVVHEAIRIAASTGEQGYIAINVSPTQVRRPGLAEDIEAALAARGLSPASLVVELTESAVLDGSAGELEQLGRLDELGVRLVVDDFGTGFSALSHLRDLPVSGIKIDRSFTRGLGADPQCHRIIESLTHLARGLRVDLVAEGVETPDQAAALAGMGCVHAQGYLFGRPQPAIA